MTLDEAVAYFDANAPRGEFVLILEGGADEPGDPEQDEAERLASAAEAVRRRVEQGQTQKDAVKAGFRRNRRKEKRVVPLCARSRRITKKPLLWQRFFVFCTYF